MGRFRSRVVSWQHRGLQHLFGIQGLSRLHDASRFRARSTSHSVAAHGGCTNIPLAAVGAQEDETILENGFLGQAKVRFVHLDPPGLLKSWKI
jgi:hypothetical protein